MNQTNTTSRNKHLFDFLLRVGGPLLIALLISVGGVLMSSKYQIPQLREDITELEQDKEGLREDLSAESKRIESLMMKQVEMSGQLASDRKSIDELKKLADQSSADLQEILISLRGLQVGVQNLSDDIQEVKADGRWNGGRP